MMTREASQISFEVLKKSSDGLFLSMSNMFEKLPKELDDVLATMNRQEIINQFVYHSNVCGTNSPPWLDYHKVARDFYKTKLTNEEFTIAKLMVN